MTINPIFFSEVTNSIKAIYNGQAWIDCLRDENNQITRLWVAAYTWETMTQAIETLVKVYGFTAADLVSRKGIYYSAVIEF